MSEQPTSGPNNPTAGTNGDWYLPYVVAAAVAATVGWWLTSRMRTMSGVEPVFQILYGAFITAALLLAVVLAAIIRRFRQALPVLITAFLAFEGGCFCGLSR